MQEKTVLFIGGDMRQRELYEIFKKENYKVYSYGLFSEEQAVNNCDFLILPFPCIKENKINIYCDFFERIFHVSLILRRRAGACSRRKTCVR